MVEAVLEGFRQGSASAAREGRGITVYALLTAMRTAARSLEIAELAVRHRDEGVVGFDIAGAEAGWPPSRHLDAFQYVKRENFHITIHAGEGFGLPVLEAMACGAPVLTTHCTSLPEVGGEAVAYTEPDAESITESLRALLDDPERREALANAGYARSQEFTWAASAEAHMACYRRAAEQHAADVSAV